ncbi:MAG: hypothetical protein IK081_10160 [Lachnospiraceae bacterium]|nr:hypothetical protein [Lachnospiraceae bacterium]
MKAIKSIGLFFITAMFFMLIGYLFGIRTKLPEGRERGITVTDNLSPARETVMPDQPSLVQDTDEPFVSFLDVSSESPFLRSDTEFVLEEVDVRKGTVTELVERLPDRYVGMDRDGFLEAMEEYAFAPPLSERKKGFIGLEVLSFSRDRVVVQKNYRRASPDDGFYLALVDYRVVVLFDDKKTVYMTTDVSLHMLPAQLQEDLADMIYVENEKELYDFLEAYTS